VGLDVLLGGGQTFCFATDRSDLGGTFVFYGSPPGKEAMARIKAPIYGFYASNDARIDATLPDTTAQMKAAGKTFEPVVYDGADMVSCAPAKRPTRMMRTRRPAGRMCALEGSPGQIIPEKKA